MRTSTSSPAPFGCAPPLCCAASRPLWERSAWLPSSRCCGQGQRAGFHTGSPGEMLGSPGGPRADSWVCLELELPNPATGPLWLGWGPDLTLYWSSLSASALPLPCAAPQASLFFSFDTGVHVAQAGLKLTAQPQADLDSLSSLRLPSCWGDSLSGVADGTQTRLCLPSLVLHGVDSSPCLNRPTQHS